MSLSQDWINYQSTWLMYTILCHKCNKFINVKPSCIMLLGQRVICNPCCFMVVKFLANCVQLVRTYRDGHLMKFMPHGINRYSIHSNTNALTRWYLRCTVCSKVIVWKRIMVYAGIRFVAQTRVNWVSQCDYCCKASQEMVDEHIH